METIKSFFGLDNPNSQQELPQIDQEYGKDNQKNKKLLKTQSESALQEVVIEGQITTQKNQNIEKQNNQSSSSLIKSYLPIQASEIENIQDQQSQAIKNEEIAIYQALENCQNLSSQRVNSPQQKLSENQIKIEMPDLIYPPSNKDQVFEQEIATNDQMPTLIAIQSLQQKDLQDKVEVIQHVSSLKNAQQRSLYSSLKHQQSNHFKRKETFHTQKQRPREELILDAIGKGINRDIAIRCIDHYGFIDLNELIDFCIPDSRGIYQHEYVSIKIHEPKETTEYCFICHKGKIMHIDLQSQNRIQNIQKKADSMKIEEQNMQQRVVQLQHQFLEIQSKESLKMPSLIQTISSQQNIQNARQIQVGNEIECLICYASYPKEEVYSSGCQHFFCQICFSSYIENEIKNSNVEKIKCPQKECNQQIQKDQIQKLVTQEIWNKYNKFQESNFVNSNPNCKWCPQVNCGGYAEYQGSDKLQCNKCNNMFCFQCGRAWHQGKKCDQEVDEIWQWAVKKDFQVCPSCYSAIQRNEGCDHMTCKCKFEFCFICRAKWGSRHYYNCAFDKAQRNRDPHLGDDFLAWSFNKLDYLDQKVKSCLTVIFFLFSAFLFPIFIMIWYPLVAAFFNLKQTKPVTECKIIQHSVMCLLYIPIAFLLAFLFMLFYPIILIHTFCIFLCGCCKKKSCKQIWNEMMTRPISFFNAYRTTPPLPTHVRGNFGR